MMGLSQISFFFHFVGLFHKPLWLQLVVHNLGVIFSPFTVLCWLRITYKGSIPEMRIWPISLMQHDFKMAMVHPSQKFLFAIRQSTVSSNSMHLEPIF